MSDIKKITLNLRCNLTDAEKIEAGKELAEAENELGEIDDERKQALSEFRARTTTLAASIASIGNKLRSGYEFRMIKCEVYFDQPNIGEKQTFRLDSGELVETQPMSEEEKQRTLPLEE